MKIHAAHILVTHKYEAEDILRKLQAGESFEVLAKKFSSCGSAANGGDLGPIEAHRLHPDFAEAAQSLKPGELSGIIRTPFGYHLIKLMNS